jgi:hypothetical protein
MNQYEKLIELIINEQEDQARELFHQIVVEKSREIYENLIDENDFDERVHGSGNQVEELVQDIEIDQQGLPEAEAEDDEMDMSMSDETSDEEGDDEGDMDMDMDDETGDEEGEEGEGDMEDRIMDLETALDELKAEFDQLMGDVDSDSDGDHDMQDHGMETGDEEMVREYVEKVAMPSNRSEGGEVGAGKSASINKQGIVAKANNMGGTSSNIAKGGAEQSADGKPTPHPSNVYAKGKGNLPGAGNFENVPGAKTKGYTTKAGASKAEGSTTSGKSSVNTKSNIGS